MALFTKKEEKAESPDKESSIEYSPEDLEIIKELMEDITPEDESMETPQEVDEETKEEEGGEEDSGLDSGDQQEPGLDIGDDQDTGLDFGEPEDKSSEDPGLDFKTDDDLGDIFDETTPDDLGEEKKEEPVDEGLPEDISGEPAVDDGLGDIFDETTPDDLGEEKKEEPVDEGLPEDISGEPAVDDGLGDIFDELPSDDLGEEKKEEPEDIPLDDFPSEDIDSTPPEDSTEDLEALLSEPETDKAEDISALGSADDSLAEPVPPTQEDGLTAPTKDETGLDELDDIFDEGMDQDSTDEGITVEPLDQAPPDLVNDVTALDEPEKIELDSADLDPMPDKGMDNISDDLYSFDDQGGGKKAPGDSLAVDSLKDEGDLDDLMEDLSAPAEEEAAPDTEGVSGVHITDEELEKIKEYIKAYSFGTRQVVKRVILEDMLSKGELEELVSLVLHRAPEKQIKKFIEKNLKIKIDSLTTESGRRVVASKEKYSLTSLQRRQTVVRYSKLLAAIFLVGLIIGMVTYRYVYKPTQAKKFFQKGIALILKPGNEAVEKPKDYLQAEKHFNTGLEYSPENTNAYNDFSLAYMEKKRFPKALAKLKEAGRINREKHVYDPVTYYNLGIYHIQSRMPRKLPEDKFRLNWPDAARDYFKRANRFGDNLPAIEGIGRSYLLENRYKKAESYYQKVLAKDPKNIIGNASLLNLYMDLDRLTDVMIQHRIIRGLKLEKEMDPYLQAKLGGYYLGKKNVRIKYNIQSSEKDREDTLRPIARDVLFNLVKEYPKFPEGRYQLAKYYAQLKARRKAFRQLEDTLRFDQNHFRAHTMMAELLLNAEDLNEAYSHLKQSIKTYRKRRIERFNPYYPKENIGKTYSLLGDLFYYHPEKIQSSPSFRRISEERPKANRYLNISSRYYEAAKKMGYDSPTQSYNYGRVLYLEGNYEKALHQWLNIQHEIYDNPHLLFALGSAFYKIGKLNTAKGEFKKLIDDYEYKASLINKPRINNSYHESVFRLLASSYNNLGVIYQRQNIEKESLLNYWQSVEKSRFLNNENPYARLNLSRAFRGQTRIVDPVLDESIPRHLYPEKNKGSKF